MVPNQHGTYYYHVHFDIVTIITITTIYISYSSMYFGDVFMCEERPGEGACVVHTQMEDGAMQEKLSAAHPYFCPTVYPLQPLPTLTPDGTHSHHNAHAYISFLASLLPFFLPSSLSFCPPLLPHPFGGHAKPGRSR